MVARAWGLIFFTAPFPPKHPSRAHVLAALPPTRTLAGIEVFFASAELRQKTDFKCPLRG
nr:MAG TPA: hypothetical protein [Caudoviricetes sp.]